MTITEGWQDYIRRELDLRDQAMVRGIAQTIGGRDVVESEPRCERLEAETCRIASGQAEGPGVRPLRT